MSDALPVSVILPTHQRRALVREAVDSVLTQTYGDFELIVVDDGSTDGTGEALAGIDERLRYHWQPNRGLSAARNAGLRLARGGIIAFLDSDDRWFPDHLETIVGVLERYADAVLACTCPNFHIVADGELEDARLVDPLPDALIIANVGPPSCVAVRLDPILTAGGFDERLTVAEDDDLWTRLALIGPFGFLQRQTVVRRDSPDSLRRLGQQRGEYLTAIRLSAARVLEEVERMPGADECGLLEPARAAVRLGNALSAIARRDADATRRELAEACRLMPRLSEAPYLVSWRIRHTAITDSEIARSYSLAATLWPDRRSKTAVALRRRAARLAARAG